MKSVALLAAVIALVGCVSYRIPLPDGTAKVDSFLKNVDVPKIVYSNGSTTLTVDGYASKGDTETITVSAGAIGAIVGAAAKAAAK